jgi:hypothetical protein
MRVRPPDFGRALVFVCLLSGYVSCSDGRVAGTPATGGTGGDGVFGGSAGAGEPAGATGEGGVGATEGGRCAAAPPFVEPRIDNFEDGNTAPVAEPGRNGLWQVGQNDAQPIPTFTVEEGGADGTDFAGHFTAPEYTENGVSLGLGVRFEGLSCPYDATGSAGISLYLKGTGRVLLKVSTEAIFSTEWGGVCDEEVDVCWDAHQKLIPLTDTFEYREIRWSDLQQAGWGKSAPFDPAGLINFLFVPGTPGEGVEFWVDELRFLNAEATESDGAE